MGEIFYNFYSVIFLDFFCQNIQLYNLRPLLFYYIEINLNFRERYVANEGTDTAYYTDWSGEEIFQSFDSNSGTVLVLAGGGVTRV